MIRFFLCALMSCCCLTGCGLLMKWFGKQPRIILQDKDKRVAGRVEQVNTEANYVLIRRYGPWQYDSEAEIVESRGGERTANLLPTGEKLGEHIAADIRSGSVEVGDAVYIRGIKASEGSKPFKDTEKPNDPDNKKNPL